MEPVGVWILAAVLACVVVGILVALGVRSLERQRPRRVAAEQLESTLAARLGRDPELAGMPLVPSVSVADDGHVTVTLSGVVPSHADRERARRVIEAGAAEAAPGAEVRDVVRVEAPGERGAVG